MEAALHDALPDEPGWRFEPKWDGFRCLAFRDGDDVRLMSKSGKPLGRYFPDVVALLAGLKQSRFVLDGELIIPVGAQLSFDALQQRLHPAASRVERLAREQPATLMLFDCLAAGDAALADQPLRDRRAALERFHAAARTDRLKLSPFTEDRAVAERWLARAGGALDGVVAKRADDPYRSGERAMVKVKRMRTADCVVGGFRDASKGKAVGSLLLGLYDADGRLDHVGFTSNMPKDGLRATLEALAGTPGFTGDAPGGPSRWSSERSAEWHPLRPELVVEVRYDHVSGGRFRHGTSFLRWRLDKAPAQCTRAQLESEASPVLLDALIDPGAPRP